MKRKGALIIAILLLSIGFAAVSTTLIINGNAKVNENTDDYSVIFTKASLDGIDVYNEVTSQDKKTITFRSKDLKKLNDTSVLTYEVTNNSSNYDAEVKINCNVKENTEAKYTSIKNELERNATKVLAKESVNGTLTITLNQTSTEEVKEEYVCELTFNAVERDTIGTSIPEPVSFSEDSWETIQKAVQTGNTSMYNVGDTKNVTISAHTNDCSSRSGGNGSSYICNSSNEPEKIATLRIANMSECTTETSETACGFVLEFVEIIDKHNYNKPNSINSNGPNNGGWKDSAMRTYVNTTIYNALPNDLQNVIITTKVISGHGNTAGETNFETQDRLYLFATKEIYGETKNDTVDSETKQLDYYKNKSITLASYAQAKKEYNGVDTDCWLRTAYSVNNSSFSFVDRTGNLNNYYAIGTNGVSPAFRIG